MKKVCIEQTWLFVCSSVSKLPTLLFQNERKIDCIIM